MPSPRETLLCRYHYDPLDSLMGSALPNTLEHHRFYCKSRLASEIQGAFRCSIVQHNDNLLAQTLGDGNTFDTTLLATDQQRSVLQTLRTNDQRQTLAYSPYGHRPMENGLLSVLGFNGERPDPVTGHYLLGNGYRAFNPVLMRFNSPDSFSPFAEGGPSAYAYCTGDPINRNDPSGHSPVSLYSLSKLKILGRRQRVKTFENTRTFSGMEKFKVRPELTPNQAINLYDQYIDAGNSFHKSDLRNALIEYDYHNRHSPTLKNIASKAVMDHKLPLNDLPHEVKRYAEFPTPPLNSRDLLEFIFDPKKHSQSELSHLARGQSAIHKSGRPINTVTAKAYEIRVESIRKTERRHHVKMEIEYFNKLFERP